MSSDDLQKSRLLSSYADHVPSPTVPNSRLELHAHSTPLQANSDASFLSAGRTRSRVSAPSHSVGSTLPVTLPASSWVNAVGISETRPPSFVTSANPAVSVRLPYVQARSPESATPRWSDRVSTRGITTAFEETTDATVARGAFSQATAMRTHSDLQLSADFDTMGLVPGLTVFVQFKAVSGRNASGAIEMVQSVSNIDADHFRALGEAWAEQRLFSERLRIKFGRVDFNSEFAGTDNGGSFLNASMGFSPSILAAPTYPLPSTALNAFYSVTSSTSLGAGVFDGRSGAPAQTGRASLFEIVQLSHEWSIRKDLPGKISVGAWRHTGAFELSAATDTAPGLKQGTGGWYSTVDQRIWQGSERAVDDERATIAAFLQFGESDRRIAGVHQHIGGGFTVTAPLAGRPADVFGVAATRAAWRTGSEVIAEMFYELPVIEHLKIVGDLQHIARRNNGVSMQAGNVLTLRTVVAF